VRGTAISDLWLSNVASKRPRGALNYTWARRSETQLGIAPCMQRKLSDLSLLPSEHQHLSYAIQFRYMMKACLLLTLALVVWGATLCKCPVAPCPRFWYSAAAAVAECTTAPTQWHTGTAHLHVGLLTALPWQMSCMSMQQCACALTVALLDLPMLT
jgi:hypothetical protein